MNRAGHTVTVFERADRIGGLLRYGIPEFKLEKRVLDRRLALLAAEGVVFRTGCHVGIDLTADDLLSDFDAVVLAGGCDACRAICRVPGRDLDGVHFAMEYLTAQNRRCAGDELSPGETITRGGQARHHHRRRRHRRGLSRHGAAAERAGRSVSSSCCRGRRTSARADNPWPQWPQIFRVSTAHEEGGERLFAVSTQAFVGDAAGRVTALRAVRVEPAGRERPHGVPAGARLGRSSCRRISSCSPWDSPARSAPACSSSSACA